MSNHKSRNVFLIITFSIITIIYLFLRFTPYSALSKFKNQNYSTRIYDCNENLIQILPLENGLRREWTSLEEIPDNVKKTFIRAEDKRFYFHFGVDFFAISKAIFQNLRAKKNVRGASTITMQLVKIISGSTKSRTFPQKISDIFNAFRLEARLSKNQILELYLNSVPFGMNVEGITSAARSFYGKELTELSLDEIKCLSVIPRRPSTFNPITNPENCANEAKVPLEAAQNAFAYKYPFFMPHYVNYLKRQIASSSIHNDGKTSSTQNNRGLSPQVNENLPTDIFTKTDLNLQFYAEKLLQNALLQASFSRISNGAILVIKNDDCSVLSWVGSENWFDNQNGGQNDGVLAKNQMGSSMKPFLYALALDTKDQNGNPFYYPSKILADIPTEFGNSNLYIPLNFNNQFNGPVRLRVALASSLNVPAVIILNDLGVESYLKKLSDLGFESLKNEGKKADLGLALGAGEVCLAELVPAFSVFVRDGKYIPLNLTGYEELQNDKILQVYSQDTARIITSILSDKASRALGFGYSQTFETNYPSIFKTGTANQYQNIVALGATKNYTVGVWMGNFSGETVVGKTGSSLPAYVAKNILDYLEKNQNSAIFLEPENWTKRKICSLSGMLAGENCPSSIYEYVKNGMPLKICSWHEKVGDSIIIKHPSEYQSWVLQNKILSQINYNSSMLKILTPQNNAIFYYSEQNAKNQTIPVEIVGGNSNILNIKYDDDFYKTIPRPFKFSLPIERGNHTLEIECANETKKINFIVK